MSPDQSTVPVMHRQFSPDYPITGDNVYYPVNHQQLRDLLGKLLTQLDAMALPDRAHRAAKTLLVQEAWRWWDGVAENATTSYLGCIAPIVLPEQVGGAPSNRWGWPSEDAYLASLAPQPPDSGQTLTFPGGPTTTAASGVLTDLRISTFG